MCLIETIKCKCMYVLDVEVNSLREKGEMENSRSVVIFQSADLLLRNVFQKRKRQEPSETAEKVVFRKKLRILGVLKCILKQKTDLRSDSRRSFFMTILLF